mmetsp:Transcript_25149/g.54899  ORF Transcript_25149/g.54899 Transcript_25149/m.54899 type:complete len:87 (-) Transcript_25149:389-649(-)
MCGPEDGTTEEAGADDKESRKDERLPMDILLKLGIAVVRLRLLGTTDDAEAVGDGDGDGDGSFDKDSTESTPVEGARDAAEVPEAA